MNLADDQQLGHYKILAPLGAGGMGEVYRAFDLRLKRDVALKILPEKFMRDAAAVERFTGEARAASALNHPNILTIYEIGQVEDRHFIAAEFIDGQTLREQLRQPALRLLEVLDVGIQVASALAAAHQAGLVHRDIKPENIMLRPDGLVKVLDFGLAKLTEQKALDPDSAELLRTPTNPGTIIGTISYMSPEQARGLILDTRSDIFSLGIVLYEMLAGGQPFTGKTMSDVLAAILTEEPVPLSQIAGHLPAELEWSITKALTKDRDERYQSVKQLLSDLKRLKQRLEFEAELRRLHESGAKLGSAISFNDTQATIQLPAEALPTTVASAPRRARTRRAIDSLAVLPLFNASDDANAEYLSDGITESIINSLSQLPKLKVVPRSTVFRYKFKEVDPQEVGRELGVRAVLAGRVLLRGEYLIIKTELVDVARQSQLWGEQYRRKMTNIFTLQEEIAEEISEKLRLKLTGAEKKRLVKRYTENTEAYQVYLKGRYYVTAKRTEEWIRKGIECFQQAIDIDPNYALAYVGLADAYAFLASSTGGWAPHDAYPKAKAAALKALELDDSLGEAHSSLGFFRLLYDWNLIEAEREFKRAIQLSPNYANAHDGYAFYMKARGRHAEAVKECTLVQQLDPLSPFAYVSLGWVYYFAHDFDQTLVQGRKALELDEHFTFAYWSMGLAFLQQGKKQEAITALSKAFTFSSGGLAFAAHLGYAYALAGKHAEALEVLNEMEELGREKYVSAYYFAIVYLGFGDLERVFQWLEKAYEERSGFLVFLAVEPMFDSLREDPRFLDLLNRIGISSEEKFDTIPIAP
jgi:serine/threonine protein kinase/Flp pilus assembly protein TadD